MDGTETEKGGDLETTRKIHKCGRSRHEGKKRPTRWVGWARRKTTTKKEETPNVKRLGFLGTK